MAIWQFECNIVPSINGVNCNDTISWKDVEQPLIEISFLERENSWSQNIIQYGKVDETCIEFIFDNDILEEILCRLDLRSLTKNTLILLIEYIKKIDAMFMIDNVLYPPSSELILEVIKQSKANKYCKSPLDYICSFDKITLLLFAFQGVRAGSKYSDLLNSL